MVAHLLHCVLPCCGVSTHASGCARSLLFPGGAVSTVCTGHALAVGAIHFMQAEGRSLGAQITWCNGVQFTQHAWLTGCFRHGWACWLAFDA